MAKKSVIVRNEKRRVIANLNYEKRAELRKLVKKGGEAGHKAQVQLSKMRRDSSMSRVCNRDLIDGRPQAYMRRFGVSRINFRKKASKGEIPGVKKASW